MDDFVGYDELLHSGGLATLPTAIIKPREHDISSFEWDKYDWNDPDFSPDYSVIRLGADENSRRGKRSAISNIYFAVVPREMHGFLTKENQRWYPKPQFAADGTIENVYACRCVGTPEGQKKLYLHRVIAEIEGALVGDHINGLGLDNRFENLRSVSQQLNLYNRRRKIRKNGLKTGVEWRDQKKTRVGGVIEVEGLKHRSEESWPLRQQNRAHAWYLAKLKELFGITESVMVKKSITFPAFPPRFESEPTVRKSLRFSQPESEIPF